VPLPHLAIRIGNMVYSHGITHLTQTPVDLYLQSERLKQNAPLPDEMSLAQHISSFKRNIDSVILNLDEKTVLGIRDQLLKETQKQYLNKTFVNSCASMVVRVLVSQGVPISQGVLDASPSLFLSYLALEAPMRKLNKFGEPLIAGFYTLVYAQGQNGQMSAFRNFMIRQMEAAVQLQIYSLPIHMAQRFAIDNQQKNLDDFYLDSPERQKFLQSVRDQADSDLRILQSYDLFSSKLENLQTRKASKDDFNKLQFEFAEEFKKEILQIQAELQDPGISFVQYNLDQFKIELLTAASAAN
jgi:hypothetical protein